MSNNGISIVATSIVRALHLAATIVMECAVPMSKMVIKN